MMSWLMLSFSSAASMASRRFTVHSDVAEEYAESRWKAERLLRVFDDANDEPATPGHTPSMPTP